MKNIYFITIIFLLHQAIAVSVMAQNASLNVITSGGNSFVNNNMSVSYTVGETITATQSSGGTILTQGFNQSKYLINPVADTIESNTETININVYPNPTKDVINCDIPNKFNCTSNILLIDEKGQILRTFKSTPGKSEIDLNSYSTGVYVLKIYSEECRYSKVFRIIKTY